MLISDWSSDVCSSDLAQADRRSEPPAPRCRRRFPAADWWWRSRRAPSSREARKAARICVEPEVRGCGKPEFRLYGKTASLPKLPCPVDGVYIDAERVRTQPVGIARELTEYRGRKSVA